jgi:hypothetical protein
MNSLAKHYDVLTPFERLPLIVAASGRGDEAEAMRLAKSAPRHVFKVADCYGLIQGLEGLANYYLMTQLDLAVHYQTALIGYEETSSSLQTKKAHAQADRLWKVAQLNAYWFLIMADAWNLVCAELLIDPEVPLRDLPGFANLKRLEAVLRPSAFSAQGPIPSMSPRPSTAILTRRKSARSRLQRGYITGREYNPPTLSDCKRLLLQTVQVGHDSVSETGLRKVQAPRRAQPKMDDPQWLVVSRPPPQS